MARDGGGSPVELAAPPWHLRGTGAVLIYRFPPSFLEHEAFLAPSLRGHLAGRLGAVILVDYLSSDVGPYRELVFLTGPIHGKGRRCLTVPKIYVSTESSALAGRANWGLPKELAGFDLERQGKVERFRITVAGKLAVDLRLEDRGLALPVGTALVPRSWRTLLQPWGGRTYLTTLKGRGRLRPARLLEAAVDPELFPDLTRGHLLAAVKVVDFRMRFPAAEVVV
jgi:Acetoacetate decarboxylase (ADC)